MNIHRPMQEETWLVCAGSERHMQGNRPAGGFRTCPTGRFRCGGGRKPKVSLRCTLCCSRTLPPGGRATILPHPPCDCPGPIRRGRLKGGCDKVSLTDEQYSHSRFPPALGLPFAGRGDATARSGRCAHPHRARVPGLGGRRRIQRRPGAAPLLRPAHRDRHRPGRQSRGAAGGRPDSAGRRRFLADPMGSL